jgi:hypothetical protein
VCLTEEVAPDFSDGGSFVNILDKAGRDSGSSVSSSDWQFNMVNVHAWEKGTRREGNAKVLKITVKLSHYIILYHAII